MQTVSNSFTRIKGPFSLTRRLPRLGKIRLGKKVQKLGAAGQPIEYPTETEFFVVPEEVAAIYGPTPTELDVLLPHEDPHVVFPQQYAMYGQNSGLKCHGDGQVARRRDAETGEWTERTCPCDFLKTALNPKGPCSERATLMVLLPRVSVAGCYQITTSSFHSTVAINSALDYIRGLAGRIAFVPLTLRRVKRETHFNQKKQTHYTLELVLAASLAEIKRLRSDPQSLMIPAQSLLEGPAEVPATEDPTESVQAVGAGEGDPVVETSAPTTTAPESPPALIPGWAPQAERDASVASSPDPAWQESIAALKTELVRHPAGVTELLTILKRFGIHGGGWPAPNRRAAFQDALELACDRRRGAG